MGTAATPTVAPICNSLATCGPYGGYGTSSAHRPGRKQSDRGGAHAVGFHLRRIHQRPRLQRSAIAAVEYPDRAAVVGDQYGLRGLCGQPHAAPRMVLQGQLPAGRTLLREQPGPGVHVSGHAADPSADQLRRNTCRLRRRAGITRNPPGFRPSTRWRRNSRSASRTGCKTLVAFTWEKCLGDSNGDFNAENGSEGAPYEYFFNSRCRRGSARSTSRRCSTGPRSTSCRSAMDRHWLTHGVLSRVLGNWETNYSFLARSGAGIQPELGRRQQHLHLDRPRPIACRRPSAGVAPLSTDPANLSNAGGSITGLQPAQRAARLPDHSGEPDRVPVVQPGVLREPGVAGGRSRATASETLPSASCGSMRWINLDVVAGEGYPDHRNAKGCSSAPRRSTCSTTWSWACPGTSIAPSFSNGTVSYGSAGVISNIANLPRSMQVAVKFLF